MATVQELLVKITGDASSFKKAIEETKNAGTQIGGAFTSVGKSISNIGMKATAAFTVPIVAGATTAINKFAEVDKTMQLTNATMGNTAEQAQLLDTAMKNAAANSTFGMNEAATATLNFARAGLTAEQAAAALAPAMNLAAGEGGNLDTVSQGLVATINGFHDSFDDAGKYADVFANACNNSALDIDSMANAMSVAAPIFSAAGYSINDAALYMGIMANAGIEASVAANSLKTGLARLVSPPKEAAEMMDKLGISVTNADGSMKDSVTIQKELNAAFSQLSESEQLAAASAIFGKNQMAPWLALINAAPADVNELSSALEQEGTTLDMANAMMSGFGGSLEKLKSSIDVAATSLGKALAPTISKLADKIQSLVDWFNSLSEEEQQTVAKTALLVAAIGPALLIFGKLVIGVGALITAFSKIGGVLGGVGGLFSKTGTAAAGISGPMSGASSAANGAAASFGTFAGQALKLAAVAGIILAAATAIKVLVESAIQLAEAGPGAVAVFAGLTVAAIGITAAIAAIGSACTATAPGLLSLGASVLLVSTGISAITASISLVVSAFATLVEAVTGLCDKLPLISEYGASAALGLVELSASVAALGVSTAAAAIPLAALDVALAAFDVTAGLATPIIAALSATIGLLDVAIAGLAASVGICGDEFKTTFDSISEIVSTAVNAIVSTVSSLVEKVVNFFKDLKYQLIGDPIVIDMVNAVADWFGKLGEKVVAAISQLVQNVVAFFTNLKDKIVEIVTRLKEKAEELFNKIKDKIVEIVTNLKNKIVDFFGKIKDKIIELTTKAKEKAIEAFNNLKSKVVETISQLKSKVQEKFNEIKQQITEKVTDAYNTAKEKFIELKTAITDKMAEIVESVKTKITDLVGNFEEIDLIEIGKNIITGFLNGIKNAWDSVTTWVSNACQSIKDSFAEALQIGSPSKVFKEYGKFVDEGFLLGLKGGYSDITKEIGKITTGVSTTFEHNMEFGGGRGSNTTINLNGDYMFQDKASMDYFLNRMQLSLQRA